MGIGASITTFSPGSTISSSTMNSNFSSINNSGLSNDGGNITTDGGGNMGMTSLTINSGHITMPNNTTLQFKNTGGTAKDVLTINGANQTQLQAGTTGGTIAFSDANGTIHMAFNMTNNSFQFKDSGNVLRDIVYLDGANSTTIQQGNSSNKMYFKNASGGALASLDGSGNFRCAGTVTASVTP